MRGIENPSAEVTHVDLGDLDDVEKHVRGGLGEDGKYYPGAADPQPSKYLKRERFMCLCQLYLYL